MSNETWTFKPEEGWCKLGAGERRELTPEEERMVDFMHYLLEGLVPEELMKEFTEEVEAVVQEHHRVA